jgi:thiol-disulfide isomerase/thioredoxin
MNGLRPAILLLTALLIVGLLASALYNTVSSGSKESVVLASVAPTCQPDPTNPQRIVLPQGSQVMDFTLTSLDGKAVKLSQQLAKAPVLLELFASWCPHCQHSAPAMNALHQANQGKLTILAVNAGDQPGKPSTSAQFKKDHHIAYPILEHPPEALMNGYCLQGFPSFYLISQKGTVVWRFAGTLKGESLAELNKALASLKNQS